MEGADIYQIAKNCRTSVEMIEKHYAAHIKTALDTSAINIRKERPRPANEQPGRGKKAKAAMEATSKVIGGAQKLQAMAPSFEVSWSSNDDKLRVIEECFPADSTCVVLGTCAENPDSQGEGDRTLICQGENEKTFLISTKTEVKMGRNMRNNSLIMFLLAASSVRLMTEPLNSKNNM